MDVSRYRHPRSAEAYGKNVFRHLNAIRQRLTADSPSRQGWLRLLKDIMDFISCAATQSAADASKWDLCGLWMCPLRVRWSSALENCAWHGGERVWFLDCSQRLNMSASKIFTMFEDIYPYTQSFIIIAYKLKPICFMLMLWPRMVGSKTLICLCACIFPLALSADCVYKQKTAKAQERPKFRFVN